LPKSLLLASESESKQKVFKSLLQAEGVLQLAQPVSAVQDRADLVSVVQAAPEVNAVQAAPEVNAVQAAPAVSAVQASVVLAALKQGVPSVQLVKKTFSAKSKKRSRSSAEAASPKDPRFAATSVQNVQKPVIWQKSSVKREKKF
jgi:hypothetical protein